MYVLDVQATDTPSDEDQEMSNGLLNAVRITHLVSQTDVMRFIRKHINALVGVSQFALYAAG